MLTIDQLTTQIDKIAACLMRSPISSKAMFHLHAKLEKLDYGIFVTACDQMSLDLEYMPKLNQIYAAYYVAKAAARKDNPEWDGCQYCENGKIYYEKFVKQFKYWTSYVGWCRHCNPPFKKDGMFGLYRDRKYNDIRFEYYQVSGGKDLTQKESAKIIQSFTGSENPEREKERQDNKDRIEAQREKEGQQEDIPF